MTKIALITGITGQDGSYLSEFLLDKQYKIYGIVRRNSNIFNYDKIDHIKSKINLMYGDLTDVTSINYIINTIVNNDKDFDVLEIYNLAAQSHVKISFDIPEYTTQVNANGALVILQIINSLDKNIKNRIKFYQAGTSEMFGKVLQIPQNEDTPFNPQSPYACAKVYSHFLTKNYRDSYNLFSCNGILFNHESPRRGDNFVTKKIINFIKVLKQYRENKENSIENFDKHLELGNIYSKRDWGHAKDYVKAMWLILQNDHADDYVISTGKTYSIKDFINLSFEKINIEIEWQNSGLDFIFPYKKFL